MAANAWRNTVGDGNWGTPGNWSLLLVPTATDTNTATFDALSPNCTVNTSDRVCNHIDFTGYTNTITMSRNITVSGNITYSATMNVVGSGDMRINAAGTITPNGKVWPNDFVFNPTTATIALSGNFEIGGICTLAATGAGTPLTINGSNLSVNGNFVVHANGNRTTVGTADIYLKGSGTWSGGSTSVLRNNLFITGAYTISGTVHYNTGTLTCNGAGSLSGGTLQITQSTTINAPNATFNNITITTNSITVTVNGATLTGTGTLSMVTNTTWDGAYGYSFTNVNTGLASSGRQVVLKSGLTYTQTSSLVVGSGQSGAHNVFSASVPGSPAYFILPQGATCKVAYADFTDVDASGGRTIRTFDGVLSNTVNIQSFTDIPAISVGAFN